MPKSIDLEQEGKREVSGLGGKAGRLSPPSLQYPPTPRQSSLWLSPAQVVLVPIARACGSPKCQVEGTEVVPGPKEGLDNG